MKRLPNWDSLLGTAVEKRLGDAFEWGKTDCVTTIADMILEYTGTDIIKDFRGTFKSEDEARAIFAKYPEGMKGVFEEVLGNQLKLESVDPRSAHRGDIALIKNENDPLIYGCGIFIGYGIIVRTKQKLATVRRLASSYAWHIPF